MPTWSKRAFMASNLSSMGYGSSYWRTNLRYSGGDFHPK